MGRGGAEFRGGEREKRKVLADRFISSTSPPFLVHHYLLSFFQDSAAMATAMAMAMERFSIREYTVKMRSADLDKCWPFDGEGDGGALPAMPVRRFRLWSDELEVAAAAVGDELMAEIPAAEEEAALGEERQSKSPGKAKQRTPKKRSIVELFAVAPQVEAVDDETDGEDGGDGQEDEKQGEGECSQNKMKERVKEKGKGELRRNCSSKEISKTTTKTKKKKRITVEMVAGQKEQVRKSELSSSVDISHILKDLVHKKLLRKSSRNLVDGQKNKRTAVKGLKKKNMVKLKESSKLNSKNRRGLAKLLPVHGILKNQTSGNSVKKVNTPLDAHKSNLIELCCESGKHVSFSVKDVILGRHKSCSQKELSQLQSLCKIFSDVLAASSATDNSNKDDDLPVTVKGAQVINVSDKDVASSVGDQLDGSVSEQRQLSCSHGHATPPTSVIPRERNCADTDKTFTAQNLDLNAAQSDSDLICVNHINSTLPPSLKYSGDPKALNFIYNNFLNSDAEIHGQEILPRMSDTSGLLGPGRKCVSGSETVSSPTITSTPRSKHSASCIVRSMEANGKQIQSSPGPKMDIFSHVPEFQPMGHLSPKDLMSNICSSVGSKKSGESSLTSDPGSTHKDKVIFEDFFGLPLNSQGELIKMHSGAKFGFNELNEKQNTELCPFYVDEQYMNSVDPVKMKGKYSGTAIYQTEQSNCFPEQPYPASMPVGFSELQGFERMKLQNYGSVKDKDQFAHPAKNPIKISCHGCRENIQVHNCIDRGKFQAGGILNHEFQPFVQPTMRLMGQNVTVGKRNKECRGFDDGRTWTGKDVMIEDRSFAKVSSKPFPEQWPQQEFAPLASRNPKNHPLEAQSSFYRMPLLLPRSDFGCQPRWMTRNGISWMIGDHSSNVDLFRHPLPTQVLLNETSNPMFNTVSGPDPVKMRHHLPEVTSHPQNICHHMLLSSTHCKHTQSVSNSSSSTPNPPFPYEEHANLSRTSFSPSSPNIPQWLLNANQQKKNHHSFCPPYSRAVDVHQPCGLLGTDLIPMPPPYTTSMVPFPVCNNNASQICGPFTTTDSILHPSFIPAITENRFTSAVNNTYRGKNKNRNGTRSNLAYFNGVDHADRPRKRHAGKEDEFMKPSKRRFLNTQDGSNTPTCHRRREQLQGYAKHNIVTPESHINRNREVDVGIPAVTNDKDGLRSESGSFSVKVDRESRPGPIKLSAGAKHILKPSLNMNRDCPTPIHSTIPFSTGTGSDKLPVSHKKVAKIYRL